MKSHLKSERGAALVLELVLLAVVLSAAGIALYHAYTLRHASNKAATPVPHKASPTQTPAQTVSDQDEIVAVLKAHYTTPSGATPLPGTKFILCKLEGNYAIENDQTAPGTAGGSEVWLKKNQGTWNIAWERQNYNPATQAASLGFPQDFGNSCSSSSPVIYT